MSSVATEEELPVNIGGISGVYKPHSIQGSKVGESLIGTVNQTYVLSMSSKLYSGEISFIVASPY